MVYLINRLLLVALALLLTAEFIPGIEVTSVYAAIMASIVLAVLNLFVRPLLFILTLPISLLTLGLFIFCINALLFWFAASFLAGFSVSGFLPALLGSLTVSLVSTFANRLLRGPRPPSQ